MVCPTYTYIAMQTGKVIEIFQVMGMEPIGGGRMEEERGEGEEEGLTEG